MQGADTRPRAGARLLLAAVLYAALAAWSQRVLLPGLGTQVYRQVMLGQDCLLHAWTLAWDQHALATAPCSLLDANILYPEHRTLLYSDHLLGLAVLLAPLRLLTDDALLVHNLVTVAAPVLDALAMHALAYDLTGSVVAAVVGGLVYGFAPLRLGIDACQIQMSAAWWLPLVLLGGLRAVRGEGARWGALAGVALAFQGLTGIYLTAFFAPFLALAHVFWVVRHPPRLARRGWAALLAAETLAALTLLPLAMAYRGVQQHLGTARSPFLNAILSLQFEMLRHVPLVTLGVLGVVFLARPAGLPSRLRHERGLVLAVTLGALVLALGPAMPLPGGLGTIAAPYRLLLALPGYTALRVPARMLHVALLGMSLVAAGGLVALQAWGGPRLRRGIAVAVLAALAIECWPPPLSTQPVPPPESTSPVYAWLAAAPPLTMVELPLDAFGATATTHQYASTTHWQRMLNGNSGVLPPMYPYMIDRLRRFPAPDVVGDLVALGITHAVVHRDRLPPGERTALERAARARRLLKPRWASGPVAVYALRPSLHRKAPPPRGTPLDRQGWHVAASAAPAFAERAIDGDPATAWSSWADLDASVQDGWYQPLSVLERWHRFLAAGPATFSIDLGAPTVVSAVQLQLGGSDPLLLPELRLEGSADGTRWAPLPLAPFPDVAALVRDAARVPMAAVLAPPQVLRFIKLVAGDLECRIGDVTVLSAW